MPVGDEGTGSQQVLCGKWMPITRDYCGRGAGHPAGACRSRKAMESARAQKRAQERPYDPIAAQRWRSKHRLTRYGLTPEKFDQMLAGQGYACAMCQEPFEDGQRVHIDHDHTLGCHPGAKQACDQCRRGLLCFKCNTVLGYIELYAAMARAYLLYWGSAQTSWATRT